MKSSLLADRDEGIAREPTTGSLSIRDVARFIFGGLFVFLGYGLFGLIYFADITERFSTLDEALLTLFSLQNGDDIQATFRSTDQEAIVSRLYFYSFLLISIYALANLFVAIIEDAYFTIEEKYHASKEKKAINQNTDLNDSDFLWNSLLKIHKPQQTMLSDLNSNNENDCFFEDLPNVELENLEELREKIKKLIAEEYQQATQEIENILDQIMDSYSKKQK